MNHIDIALKEVGHGEMPQGSNWGFYVQNYLASVGRKTPAPWCAAFVYWCCYKAGYASKLVKTAGVLDQWRRVNPKYKISPSITFGNKHFYIQDLKPGDIFIMDFGKGLGHMGIVWKVENGVLCTIEGNATTVSGSREGVEVCIKNTRKAEQFIGIIRII